MEYIYSRVSTDSQSTDSQTIALTAKYPNARVVTEVASGAKSRPMLKSLTDNLIAGDTLIVAALDRIGRCVSEVLVLIEKLHKRGVILISLREAVNYSTPVGRLITQVLASVAELERSLISERTKAGLSAARAQGRYGGRPRSISDETIAKGKALVDSGSSVRMAAKQLKISHVALGQKLKELAA